MSKRDAIIAELSRLHLFRGGSDMRAWLFTIMHGLFVDAPDRVRGRLPRGGSGGRGGLRSSSAG